MRLLGESTVRSDAEDEFTAYPFQAICISEAFLAETLVSAGMQRYPRQVNPSAIHCFWILPIHSLQQRHNFRTSSGFTSRHHAANKQVNTCQRSRPRGTSCQSSASSAPSVSCLALRGDGTLRDQSGCACCHVRDT